MDELAHGGQHLVLVPGIARRELQIEQDIRMGITRHDAQVVDRKAGVELAGLSIRRVRSTPTAASVVTMGS